MKELHFHSLFLVLHWSHSVYVQELYYCTSLDTTQFEGAVQCTYDSAALAPLSLLQLYNSTALDTTQFTGAVGQRFISATPLTVAF